MNKRNSNEVLIMMIERLKNYIEELADYKNVESEQFQYGEKVAYTECLEIIQEWEYAEKNGLDFDIEDRYPL